MTSEPQPSRSAPPLQVLMVDDHPENLLALEAMLGDMGYHLVRANSGREALRCLLKQDFAVILLDVQMPEMDGFETARLIRSRDSSRQTPIIFLTAAMRTEDMVLQGYALGGVDYLLKPLVQEILRAKVQFFAELHQTRAELARAVADLRESERTLETRCQARTAELAAANESLQQSNELNQSLLRSLPFGVQIVQEDGTVLMVAGALDTEAGRSALGKLCWEVYRDGGQQCGQCPLRLPLGIGETRTIETDGINGGRIFEITHTGLMYQDRKAVLEVFHDITEQQQMEREIRASEVRYRQLFDEAGDGICVHDAEGRIVDANQTLCRQLGYTHAELLQLRGEDIEVGLRTEVAARSWQHLRAGHPEQVEGIHRRKDGSTYPAEIRMCLVAGESKGLYLATVRDLTERKQAEAALHERDQRLANCSANMPGMLYQFLRRPDGSYCVPFASANIKPIFGVAPEEVRQDASPIIQAIVPEDRARVVESIEESAREITPWSCEYRVRLPDQSVRWMEGRSTPQPLPDGSILWHGYNADITERKRGEILLTARAELAAMAQHAPLPDLMRAVLDQAEQLSESQVGFFHFVDKDQENLHLQQWSTNTLQHMCTAEGQGQHYPVSKAGVWVDCLKTRHPVIHNDYASLPNKRGMPAGHAPVIRELVVPVIRDGLVVAILGVGNKPVDYTDQDVELIQHLADSVSDLVLGKRAEAGLVSEHSLLAATLESTGDGILVVDREGRITGVNRQLLALWRVPESLATTPEAALMFGHFRSQLLDGDGFLGEVAALEQTPEAVLVEEIHLQDQRMLETYSQPQSIGGKVVGRVWSFRDITQRKRSEAALQASLAFNRALVRTIPFGLTIVDAQGVMLFMNPAMEALVGTLVPGRHCCQYFDCGSQCDLEWILGRPQETGRAWSVQRDGLLNGKVLQITCADIEFEGRRATLAVFQDVTEAKRLEQQSLRSQRMESLGMLAGGIAHDLNNILTPIMMSSALLREAISAEQRESLAATIKSCSQRGTDLIKQLLAFARGKSEGRTVLPIQYLLKEIAKLIRETFPRNIEVVESFPRDLRSALGDATRIHQAVMNLCVNARDAMPEGGRLVIAATNRTVDAGFVKADAGEQAGDYVCVSIRDTGTGIPPEHLGRIFEPFFTTKGEGKGTGLGLPNVQVVMREHNGFLRVSSEVGRGTTFDLYFPATQAPVSEPSKEVSLPPRADHELVLVVDDETTVRDSTRRLLEHHGYRVLVAAEGGNALSLFAAHQAEVRLVLTDVMMPGIQGPALAKALRDLAPGVLVVGMTGLAEVMEVSGPQDLGFDALVAKPFTKEALLNVLHRTLTSQSPNADR